MNSALEYGSLLCLSGAAIVIAVTYSVLVHTKAKDEIWSWYHRLVSTVVSVILGIAVALGMFLFERQKVRSALTARHRTILSSEIAEAYEALRDTNSVLRVTVGRRDYIFTAVAVLEPSPLEVAGRSGLFPEAPTLNMLRVAQKMRLYSELSRTILRLGSPSPAVDLEAGEEYVRGLYNNHRALQDSMSEGLDLIKRQVCSE